MPIVSRLNVKRNDDEEFDLAALMSHYGVRISGRLSQMTNCPLHEDRTPSLSVNIGKGLWNCHSCGEGGNTLTLIALKEEVDYRRAREIAEQLGAGGGGSSAGPAVREGAYGRAPRPGKRRSSKGPTERPTWLRG